jgi:hypothetical protein
MSQPNNNFINGMHPQNTLPSVLMRNNVEFPQSSVGMHQPFLKPMINPAL